MVSILLERFARLTPEEAADHFIHLNSVKCSANQPRRSQAPWHMFMNCRWYLPDEVRAVEPDVIVTQGDGARNALWGAFPAVLEAGPTCSEELHSCFAQVVQVNEGRQALWLHTYHPNQRGGLFQKALSGYRECYPSFIYDFMKGRR